MTDSEEQDMLDVPMDSDDSGISQELEDEMEQMSEPVSEDLPPLEADPHMDGLFPEAASPTDSDDGAIQCELETEMDDITESVIEDLFVDLSPFEAEPSMEDQIEDLPPFDDGLLSDDQIEDLAPFEGEPVIEDQIEGLSPFDDGMLSNDPMAEAHSPSESDDGVLPYELDPEKEETLEPVSEDLPSLDEFWVTDYPFPGIEPKADDDGDIAFELETEMYSASAPQDQAPSPTDGALQLDLLIPDFEPESMIEPETETGASLSSPMGAIPSLEPATDAQLPPSSAEPSSSEPSALQVLEERDTPTSMPSPSVAPADLEESLPLEPAASSPAPETSQIPIESSTTSLSPAESTVTISGETEGPAVGQDFENCPRNVVLYSTAWTQGNRTAVYISGDYLSNAGCSMACLITTSVSTNATVLSVSVLSSRSAKINLRLENEGLYTFQFSSERYCRQESVQVSFPAIYDRTGPRVGLDH